MGSIAVLTQRFCDLSAGCEVDANASHRWGATLPTLRKLGEAYRMGWLHNVLSRITPLTMQRRDDYVMMADLFVLTAQEAEHILNRFDSDLETFCAMAEITVSPKMTAANVSDELRAHVDLYSAVQDIFVQKFKLKRRDPIQTMANNPIMTEQSNPFVKDFVDQKFDRKRKRASH